MKKGPSFTERLINNTSNVGLLATSLFSAPFVRDLFTSAVEQTLGQPSTPQTYIPFVIAREAVGYLATPLIVKAGLQFANKAVSFLANKAKSWFTKEAPSTAVAIRPTVAPTPQKEAITAASTAVVAVPRPTASTPELTPLQRLQKLLLNNPEANKIVTANLEVAQTKLFNHPKLGALVPQLEKLKPKEQQEFVTRFLPK